MSIDELLVKRILDLAVKLQQIPAPPFGEEQRAAFMYEQMVVEGLVDVSRDELGNVYGRLPGVGEMSPLVITAHLDTVFPATTALTVRREEKRIYAPGIGDNSIGVAGLLGLVWALRSEQDSRQCSSSLAGDVWLVANVGEEGLGNLRGMRAVVERFGGAPLAYLVLEGMALGHIYHRGLGVRRYQITVRTPGGHAWVDYGRPSAIHELAALVNRLVSLPVPSRPRSSLNVGVISGGTSVNTIAAEAHLELDLRSEGVQALESLVRKVEDVVQSAQGDDVWVECEEIGRRPAGKLSVRHPLVRLAKECLRAQGIQPILSIGSTDANLPLSHGLPALCLGLTTGSGAHTQGEYIDVQPLYQGLGQLLGFVEGVFCRLS